MVIDGYELSKYIDPVTARIMNFIHKAKILYSCNEDNNTRNLKYTYLNMCAYNKEKENVDYYKLLTVNFSNYDISRETSSWTIEYNNYSESIRRKCKWCNIKPEICPIKEYADLKNFAKHNKIDINKIMERLVEEPNIKTISNEVIERNVANQIVRVCDDFVTLKMAQMLVETKAVEIVEFSIEGNINYKYVDLNISDDSLINNLYNFYTGIGSTLTGTINANLMNEKENNVYSYSPHKLAAYIIYLCRKEKVSYDKVFEAVYSKCSNIEESKFATYYRWFIYKIELLDCNESVKEQIKEVITYIKNYDIKYKYHLPYIPINLNIQIEDEQLLENIIEIIYRLAISCEYIKSRINVIDAEYLCRKCDKSIDIIFGIERNYKDTGLVVIKNLEKVVLSQERTESLFYTIENCIKDFPKTMTIIATKTDMTNIINGFPALKESIRHNITVKDYTVEQIESKLLEKLKNNFTVKDEFEKNIRKYIEADYLNSNLKNNDYIDSLYEKIAYNNFNKSEISSELNDDKLDYEELSTPANIKNIDDLIGLEEIKREIYKFKNLLIFNKKISNKIDSHNMNMNMLFLGNPGTGKTTVAAIMANILYELGYIKKNKFIEVTAKDLVAEYIGQTAIKTSKVIENALDGVLFIDEAYSIISMDRAASFGRESMATLVQAMEKYRDRLIVIFAGYTIEMKKFLDSNSGIASRIGYTFEFNNYETNELMEILEHYAIKKGFNIQEDAKKEISDIVETNKNSRNFGNARFMINLFEKLVMIHAQNFDDNNLMMITKADVIALKDENYNLKKSIQDVRGKLSNLVGLKNAKEELDGLIDLVILNNKLEKRVPLNLNMIFIGNPGTGKTTVARIFAEILYNLGYIKNNKLIEVTGKDIIGEYVGQTSSKTAKVLENALDGLLFIDEAYTIMGQQGTNVNYSQDAMSTITKYMTDYEGRLTIIFAGYKKEMKEFVELNPGLISRIGETVEFDDYNEEELLEIFKQEVQKAEFIIEQDAENKVLDIIKENKNSKNFGNARFILNVFKKTLMQHAKRCINTNDINELKKITIEDIPEIKMPKEKKIGF